LIYINDIGELGLHCKPNLFADDSFLYYVGKDPSVNEMNAQCDLDNLQEYFRLNKLTLNVQKTKFMNIYSRRKLPPVMSLNYGGVNIEEVNEFRYLGVILDKHITWRGHINYLRSKLSVRVVVLRKLSNFLPRKILLLLLYFKMIHCHLNYLCVLWGSAAISHLKPLQVLQNRVLKFIYGLPAMYSTSELYSLTGVLPVKGLYCYQVCLFVKGSLLRRIYSTVEFKGNDHEYKTRSQNVLYYKATNTNIGMSGISFIGPRLFNYIPNEITNLVFHEYKKILKMWLLEKNQLDKLSKLYLLF